MSTPTSDNQGEQVLRTLIAIVNNKNNREQAELLKPLLPVNKVLKNTILEQRNRIKNSFIECATSKLIRDFDQNLGNIQTDYLNTMKNKLSQKPSSVNFKLCLTYKNDPSLNDDLLIMFIISKQVQIINSQVTVEDNQRCNFKIILHEIKIQNNKKFINRYRLMYEQFGLTMDQATKLMKRHLEEYMNLVNIPVYPISECSMYPIPNKYIIDKQNRIKIIYDPYLVIKFVGYISLEDSRYEYSERHKIQNCKNIEDELIKSLLYENKETPKNDPTVDTFIKFLIDICKHLEYQHMIVDKFRELYQHIHIFYIKIVVDIFLWILPDYIGTDPNTLNKPLGKAFVFTLDSYKKVHINRENGQVTLSDVEIEFRNEYYNSCIFKDQHEQHISEWLTEFFKSATFPINGLQSFKTVGNKNTDYKIVTKENPLHFNFKCTLYYDDPEELDQWEELFQQEMFAENHNDDNQDMILTGRQKRSLMKHISNQCANDMFEKAVSIITPVGSAGKSRQSIHNKYIYKNRQFVIRTGSRGGRYILVQGKKHYIDK